MTPVVTSLNLLAQVLNCSYIFHLISLEGRKNDYVVSIADNGEKALELFDRYGTRLIILDIMLPGLDGFTVCSKIRENMQRKRL